MKGTSVVKSALLKKGIWIRDASSGHANGRMRRNNLGNHWEVTQGNMKGNSQGR